MVIGCFAYFSKREESNTCSLFFSKNLNILCTLPVNIWEVIDGFNDCDGLDIVFGDVFGKTFDSHFWLVDKSDDHGNGGGHIDKDNVDNNWGPGGVNDDDGDLSRIAKNSYIRSIRAAVGLIYYFAKITGQLKINGESTFQLKDNSGVKMKIESSTPEHLGAKVAIKGRKMVKSVSLGKLVIKKNGEQTMGLNGGTSQGDLEFDHYAKGIPTASPSGGFVIRDPLGKAVFVLKHMYVPEININWSSLGIPSSADVGEYRSFLWATPLITKVGGL